ncbi:uncharacterized protein LOC105646522 isoform X3 [Jatropha curcas]|uniref:uncharacterized protein LOC105646522 isoform X3 n=1 Tax=Jatropha curcas TaxID=180498 RepID=UPI0005FAABA5|nr:uncharacterized protein LOC105646522 isoform X3 [Jatropha curcas]
MMNSGSKAAFFMPQSNCFQLRAALFHSTPVLERKRGNFWDARPNGHPRRSSKWQRKQALLRNIGVYTDYFFENWRNDSEEDDPSPSRGTSWFRKQYSRGSRRNRTGNQGAWRSGKSFQFCEDDIDVENIFRSMFGGNRYFYWSFINGGNPQWRSSSSYSNYYGRNWRYRVEYDHDSSTESDDNVDSNLASERIALGLNASGPLKLEDVKNAYRACALKWHPDRHQGSSKAIAEEKFKHCSAAYQSLCDKLGTA